MDRGGVRSYQVCKHVSLHEFVCQIFRKKADSPDLVIICCNLYKNVSWQDSNNITSRCIALQQSIAFMV